ncbi:MAG: tRNA preQ1(34) S-adenosylmethionine ribosyltransferase-isomerase QueA [Proteobacteria bacterium]|nr:tRNA preQ1(34) S-adenosylmethionine ribosyltransferase-isomerase QueA [Pseudomonadota bacterium]
MRVDAFDFEIPPELIALRPRVPREEARLLVVREDGRREHRTIGDLPSLLRAGDALVVNDTKVIAAQLHGQRRRGITGEEATIHVTLHARVDDRTYRAFARPAKRLRQGDEIVFGPQLSGQVVKRDEGEVELSFDRSGTDLDSAIASCGETPLPPYIASRRKPDKQDRSDYQTVYAVHPGSVAAPTAGLHFTPQLLARLQAAGAPRETVTLHVGAGTFLPVTVDDTSAHRMHPEWAQLDADAAARLNAVRAEGGRIVAVGSTALRTLESAADQRGQLHAFSGATDIFITPGYRFKTAQVLLTNFHLPRSTLFMLVCAFSGIEAMQAAYAEAIHERYRFYSYGDACLLFRSQE